MSTCRTSLLAEALFLVFADGRKETSAMDNLVPRAHVPFGPHEDTELWNNQQACSQSPHIFCF